MELSQIVAALVAGAVGAIILLVLRSQNEQLRDTFAQYKLRLSEIDMSLMRLGGQMRETEKTNATQTQWTSGSEKRLDQLQADAKMLRDDVSKVREDLGALIAKINKSS